MAQRVFARAEVGPFSLERIDVTDTRPGRMARVHAALEARHRQPQRVFIIVNFVQRVFLPDGDAIGHHAVVADIDPRRGEVVILDVDAEVDSTYLVEPQRFIAGMLPQLRGGQARGLLVIRLGESASA